MRESAPLQPFLLSAMISFVTLTAACGGGRFNDPPGIRAAAVVATQNPLVAQYTVTTALGCSGQVLVEFGPDTSYGRTTAWYPVSATRQTTTILVAGMKASTTYHMRAQAQAQCMVATNSFVTDDSTFTTGPLPGTQMPTASSSAQLPAISVTLPTPGLTPSPGVELLSLSSPGPQALVVDLQGNVIWYCPGNAEPGQYQ